MLPSNKPIADIVTLSGQRTMAPARGAHIIFNEFSRIPATGVIQFNKWFGLLLAVPTGNFLMQF